MPEAPSFKLRRPPAPPTSPAPCELPYAELEVTGNFSFLRGASHPDELVHRAAELGYRAIAITDVNTLAGAVRAHAAAKSCGMKLLIGARLVFQDGPDLLVWAPDRTAYGRLCRLLTIGKRRAEKGGCHLFLEDFLQHGDGLFCAVAGFSGAITDDACRVMRILRRTLRDRVSLAISCSYNSDDQSCLRRMIALGRQMRIPLLATNNVHYHDQSRRALQDVLVCIRHGCTVRDAGFRLFANAERHLKSPARMHRLFAEHPQAIARGIEIAEQCTFSLDELRYEYPDELVPPGQTPIEHLSRLTWAGAAERYPDGIPDKVRAQLEHELKLIEQLKFEAYFLTVHDIVRYARSRGILCQGRGSAANSAVCYCIGITSVDPAKIDLLFERFVSAARNEPPDIDVDFEHERREEVIQYVYRKYGRDRCGVAAEVITYRGRSAVRDVGKAMGLSLDMVDSLARRLDWWHRGAISEAMIREAGLDPADRTVRQVAELTAELLGFPRHLSQHVGGMVMTRGPLCEMVPIENAAMPDRTVIEWDKDDIDELGILKVDVLGLGMLSCISRAFRMLNESDGATKRRSDEGERKQSDGATKRRSDEGERKQSDGATKRRSDEGERKQSDGATKRRSDEGERKQSDGATKRRSDEGERKQSDEATERRSYEGTEGPGDEATKGENGSASERMGSHGHSEDVSRSDCVAAGDGAGEAGLCGDGTHACVRAIRIDRPDAPSGDLDSLEHRRRSCQTESPRLSETSAYCTRIVGRVIDAERAGGGSWSAATESATQQPSPGRRPNTTGSDREPGAEDPCRELTGADHSLGRSVASSLCCSVSFPLRPFVASSLRRCALQLHTVPAEDPLVYDMICDADTVGVFQIESRAQMSMLPRLRPRCFYDLVIEVAIVRPGPIQGNMVHPYLRRRNGQEPVSYPSEALRQVLHKTLGVPLFQEQAMKIAMVGAGFSAAEADQLRRAMAAWRKSGELLKFHDKIVQGMIRNGYSSEFAEQCFNQIKGFGEYGFPESHAASFALLVYVSAWLKRHHPAAFCAALLNSQPMGFYAPAQIVRDAREHGVDVRPVDVNHSFWDCTLEQRSDGETKGGSNEATKRRSDGETKGGSDEAMERRSDGETKGGSDEATERRREQIRLRADWGIGGPAVRLGFRQIKGMRQDHADAIVRARESHGPFTSIDQFHRLTELPVSAIRRLAEADAFTSLYLSRRQALWDALELKDDPVPLFSIPSSLRRSVASSLSLPAMPLAQEVRIDYQTTGLSLKRHPMSFVREALSRQKIVTAAQATSLPNGKWVKVAGMVLVRQRPGTASGIVFMTLEDETGIVNLIVRPHIFDRYRPAARHAGLLQCEGHVQRQGQVVHVVAGRLLDRSELVRGCEFSSRDFH